jgi:hypothetical protein
MRTSFFALMPALSNYVQTKVGFQKGLGEVVTFFISGTYYVVHL